MTLGKYRNTPLASIILSDSLTGLLTCRAITPDICAAGEHIPMKFDPVADAEFFRDIYWNVPIDAQIAAGSKILKRFHSWFKNRANPMDLIYMAVTALTESDDSLDTTIEEINAAFLTRDRIQMVDSDDTIFYVVDYEKARIPDTAVISSIIDDDRYLWWRIQFESQAHRVIQVPHLPFEQFREWNTKRIERTDNIVDQYRRNAFVRAGSSLREGRKILRRSARFFSAFYGDEAIRQFIRGKPLKIRATYYEWELQLRPKDLLAYTISPPQGHVPYKLILNDLDGRQLAEGCVLFRETPVLDQAVAIGISVTKPEDELDLLRETNFFRLTKEGLADERLRYLPRANRANEIPFDPSPRELPQGWRGSLDVQVAVDRFRAEIAADQVSSILDDAYNDYGPYRTQWISEPLIKVIRQELYRKLDVPPEILDYMIKPECRYGFLRHNKRAPRLETFIEHGRWEETDGIDANDR